MAGPSRDVPPRGREKGVLVERFFSREGKYLPLILRLRLAFLAVLVALSFALPLSRPERGGAHTRCRDFGRAQLGDLGPGEAAMKHLFAVRPEAHFSTLRGGRT
jgi:hypothetical protein